MDLTAGTRATAAGATLVMTVGIAVVMYGLVANDLARSLGGACLTMTALTLLALVAIRRWVTDTTAERARLSAATRDHDAERIRYIAAQGTLDQERHRLQRDAAADREQNRARLEAERAVMQDEFEEQRAELICGSLETALHMLTVDKLLEDERKANAKGAVISFQSAQRAAERERARGH